MPHTNRRKLWARACAGALSTLLAASALPITAQEVVDLPSRDRAASLTVEPAYEIGGMNAQDWQLLGTPVLVGFDADGALKVLDENNYRVLSVDPSGSLGWEAGGEGGGPGEFGLPMGMAVEPSGGVTVYDLGHQAFVQFAADGSYIDQEPHALSDGIPGRELVADPLGGIVFSSAGGVSVRRQGGDASVSVSGGGSQPIRRMLAGGRDGVAYQAWRMPTPPMEAMSGGAMQMQMPAERAFEPDLFYSPLNDGRLVVVDTVDYSVKVVGSNGAIDHILRRPIEPQRVGRSEREAEKQRRLDELEEGGGPQVRMLVRGGSGGSSGGNIQTPGASAMREMMEGRIENMVFADYIPVIADVGVDPWNGQIWVRRTGDDLGEDGPIDVLTAEGDYLGTLAATERMPDAFGPGGLVAYVETDEFDVTRIEVARVQAIR